MKKDSSKYMSRKRFSAKKLSGKHRDSSKLQSSGDSHDSHASSIKKEDPIVNSLESSSNYFKNQIDESKSSENELKESTESTESFLFETKKNKSSKTDFKGIGTFLNVYGEASISMEKQLGNYKNDLHKLQKEFDDENDRHKRELIKVEMNIIMQNIKKVKTQMKKLFNGANTITSKAIDMLNSGDSERKGGNKRDKPAQKYFKDTEIYKKLFKDNLK